MITCAAVRAKVNGEINIFPCHRHSDFFRWMKLLHCNFDKSSVEQGFIYYWNGEERFVDRKKALKIIRANGQQYNKDEVYDDELYSEALY